MRISRNRGIVAVLIALAIMAAIPAVASAHERREVANMQFVVGFDVEPAFEGEPNAAAVRISHTGRGEPVTGAGESLQLEVTHVPTGQSSVMPLREAFGSPGYYVANFIPTAPGTYEFHFTGAINDEAVDETFTSSPTTFSDIEPTENVQFPVQVPSGRELESAARGASDAAITAEDAADSASGRASTAMALAVAGLVVGLAGLAAGAAGMMSARRRG